MLEGTESGAGLVPVHRRLVLVPVRAQPAVEQGQALQAGTSGSAAAL